jgi:hypothetical protein
MPRRHSPVQDPPSPLAPRRVRREPWLSRHAEERARQRGFRTSDFELVAHYGSPVHDGFILTPRDVERAEASLKQLAERLRRLVNVFVPVSGPTATSIYRPDAPKRRRRLQEAHC